MKKILLVLFIILFVMAVFSGNTMANAMGDENYNDHSEDGTQPGAGLCGDCAAVQRNGGDGRTAGGACITPSHADAGITR